jgi:hypothetical protein
LQQGFYRIAPAVVMSGCDDQMVANGTGG